MNVELKDDAARLVKTMSIEQNVSEDEIIRRCIATEYFITRKKKQGCQILIHDGQKISELVYR